MSATTEATMISDRALEAMDTEQAVAYIRSGQADAPRKPPRLQAPVRFICATCGYHTLYARYLVEHVVREGTCRSCGFRHDAGDCPRWPVTP